MWSKSKTPRFDLTLSGRNVVKEHTPKLSIHTAPGRGYNSRQYRYLDIRDLLQGSYAPSWRLEKSRDVSKGVKLDPLPAPRDVDQINDFLSRSADPRLQGAKHPKSHTSKGSFMVSGSACRTSHGRNKDSSSFSISGLDSSRKLKSPVAGAHETLEEEYRALRDLTRAEPRYVEPTDVSTEYLNFVEPKPLHEHGMLGYDDIYQNDEDDDSYYGEDESFAERFNTADSDILSQNNTGASQQNGTNKVDTDPKQIDLISGGGGNSEQTKADILVVGDDFAPSLSPIAESTGPLRGWTFVEGEEGQQAPSRMTLNEKHERKKWDESEDGNKNDVQAGKDEIEEDLMSVGEKDIRDDKHYEGDTDGEQDDD